MSASALPSARASSSRALIPNIRLVLACYSVAAAYPLPLRAYLASSTRSLACDALMRCALTAAIQAGRRIGTSKLR